MIRYGRIPLRVQVRAAELVKAGVRFSAAMARALDEETAKRRMR